MLITVEQAIQAIQAGKTLFLAGDEDLLRQLPRGKWIGGSIPYFMSEAGGLCTATQLFATEAPPMVQAIDIREYDKNTLENIPHDAPENGFTLLIIPSFSSAHIAYAHNAPNYPSLFLKPIIGWIAGVHLERFGELMPTVFNGETGAISNQHAIAMHLSLPTNYMALIHILNLFKPSGDDVITFDNEGFMVKECLVNGKKWRFAEYLLHKKADIRYPLVADYCGALVNVSFQGVDRETGMVHLYAPVFKNVPYKLAHPLTDYIGAFYNAFPKDAQPVFACNCILNYLYSELEGKITMPITGPMTFGEIAYQLLNQTLVYLEIKQV
ncbi:DUF6976 family protein [Beggiatoa leptomitoformis]|uniref:Uncharacterized protein n=1 Tax=Beggiatoa leptomitoformis TaxID=288004 RepID=A0A2N9YIA7_9GAMM|nr:hypothetical protein [Beggiatoa leptomitoformis]ALG67550.1 hypothetical protein AL038_07345 [Beggiatoa leptomitoformis]AUI70224.1 hypothetical protein BLE401_16970 [Beggiatoa leptomitoformis]